MWFQRLYGNPERGLGFQGCSSHSGRRTSITRAARMVSEAGGAAAAITLAPADLWKTRLAVKTLRRDQREAIAEAAED